MTAPKMPELPTETVTVRFDILHAYAAVHGLEYNELCRTVRDAIADGSRSMYLAGYGAAREDAKAVCEREANQAREASAWLGAFAAEECASAIAALPDPTTGE